MATLAEIVKTVGVPLAAVWFYAKYLAPKQNGRDVRAITQHLDGLLKEADHHSDLDRTQHFDQLRRDLTTTIEKTVESKLTAYFLQLELDRRGRGKR